MDAAVEDISLTDAHSIIDIRGGKFDSALVVAGKPIALSWSDCEGSIAQYLARAGATNYEETLQNLRRTLDGNLRADIPLSSQIYPFLELFVPGNYRLQYDKGCSECDFVEYTKDWSPATQSDAFYPFGRVLIFTQPTDSLNRDGVEQHARAIKNGLRPIALTATVENGWCQFVLDGHHKLQAYKSAKIDPALISVCRLDAPRLTRDAFDAYICRQHPMRAHYRDVKTKYDFDRNA